MPYETVTLATLRTRLQEKWESVPFWTDEEARTALNEAIRDWNMLTGAWKRREIITTVANQVWYNLTSTMVYEIRADFGSFPMDVTSLDDLDNGRPNWEGETTATSGVPDRPTLFAPAGLTLFAIWPAHAAGGTTLVFDSVRETPVLVNDADFVDIGEDEFNPLLGFALNIAAFKRGGPHFQATMGYYRQFMQAAILKNGRLKAGTFFRRFMGQDVYRSRKPIEAGVPPFETVAQIVGGR